MNAAIHVSPGNQIACSSRGVVHEATDVDVAVEDYRRAREIGRGAMT